MEIEEIVELTNKIYKKIVDEESRDIYVNRVLYNMTKEAKYMRAMALHWEPVKQLDVWIRKRQKKRFMIYGAGVYGKTICDMFFKDKDNLEGFIDQNKDNQIVEGFRVFNLKDIDTKMYAESAIIVSNKKGYQDIKEKLKDMGANYIVCFGESVNECGEYFEDFIPHSEEEVFVDAGVYDGKTTLDFVTWSKVYQHIYMFEPSVEYKKRYYKNIEKLDNCEWIDKGLGQNETTLHVFDRPDHDISVQDNLSGIQDKYEYQDGKWIDIPVTSIDNMLKNRNVTFIKMDIEGAEKAALYGSEKTIKRCHPKLAICLYHKIEDPWRLPQIIMEFDPTYKFYLRHYSFDMLDTVLYAI